MKKSRIETKIMATNNIHHFQNQKTLVKKAKEWFSLYLKEYFGGGGGIGELIGFSFSCEIYYQESNGAQNYHKPEKEFKVYLDLASSFYTPQIIEMAIKLAEADLKKKAIAAKQEAEEILEAVENE